MLIDRNKAREIQKSAWITPEEFKAKLIENQGKDIKLQLKGEKNQYVTIIGISQNEVTLSEPEGKVISVPMSNVAGFTNIIHNQKN